ncbi:hypothetical protein [Desulfoplanes sp.]
MKRLILCISLFVCCALVSPPVFANTITFDTATQSSPGAAFTIDEATFHDFFLGYDQVDENYLAADFAYGAAGSDMSTINFSEPVYLTGFDYFASGLNCLLNHQGTTISGGMSFLGPSSTAWTPFVGGGALIDEIVFQLPSTPATTAASLNLDNLEYEAVPIPGGLALLASALLGITGFRKKYMS